MRPELSSSPCTKILPSKVVRFRGSSTFIGSLSSDIKTPCAATVFCQSALRCIAPVKFLEEDNLRIRSLSEADEENVLQCCSPYLEDLVTFAINTGLRLGEILNLRWEEVDLEHAVIKMLVRKNRRMLEVPLNDRALAVVNGWSGLRKCEYVFYNRETGGQWKDLWLGLKKACRKAGLNDVTWHGTARPFVSICDNALRPYEPRSKKAGSWAACRKWCRIGDTAHCALKPRGDSVRK